MPLLTNKLFMAGQGLQNSAVGPRPYSGAGAGLLRAAENERLLARDDEMRELREMRMMEMRDRMAAAARERENRAAAIGLLPAEQQTIATAYPSVAAKLFERNLAPTATTPHTAGMPEGMMWDAQQRMAVPIPGAPAPTKPGMTEYQKAQLALGERRMQLDEAKAMLGAQEKDREAAEEIKVEQEREASKIQQNTVAVNAIDKALDLTDAWFASGAGSTAAQWLGLPAATEMAGHLSTIKSAIGLERLIKVKEQGGTFGALSGPELQLLVDSLGALQQGMPDAALKRNLQQVRRLFVKSGIDEQELARLKSEGGDSPNSAPPVEWNSLPNERGA